MGLVPYFLVAILAFVCFDGAEARTEPQDITALVSFRDNNKYLNLNWPLESVDPCDNPSLYRYVIQCLKPTQPHFPSRVGGINLNCHGLSGPLPNFSNFTALRLIDLSNNKFNGTLNETILGPRVEILNLYNNSLSGTVPSFSGVTGLKELYLSRNNFNGTIPEFGGSLKVLSLNSNNLTGTIPVSIFGNHPDLEQLFIGNNTLEGTIPPEVGMAMNLVIFSAWRANLTGTIPSNFAFLQKLRFLYLDRNNLTGSIPEALGFMAELRILYLRDNHLTGEIPVALTYPPNLSALSLAFNNLTGTLPEFDASSQIVLLHIYFNPQINGTIPPGYGNLKNLTSLDLSGNSLTGALPNSLEGLTNNTKFKFLNLAWNNLVGNFSTTFLAIKPNTSGVIDVRQNTFYCGTLPNWCNQLGNGMCVTGKCLLAPVTSSPIINPNGKRSSAAVEVNLKWTPSLEMKASKNIVYEAEMTEEGASNFRSVYKGSQPSATLAGLFQNKNYHIRIRAVNSGLVGPWSPTLFISP